uniref:Uncharacterized protein n=1 Tax=Megaviridae environmental sample TaxID=1737588 RepID=A0A5J6VIZ8_9VIRU|nr:MAG: hypothetical protein [Megaviridae environmental sample]
MGCFHSQHVSEINWGELLSVLRTDKGNLLVNSYEYYYGHFMFDSLDVLQLYEIMQYGVDEIHAKCILSFYKDAQTMRSSEFKTHLDHWVIHYIGFL